MEAACAVEMWGRSEQHQMQYKTFVSDGDSSAFNAVTAMGNGKGPYGEGMQTVKVECVNHVAKRLGTGFRNVKKNKAIDDEDEDEEPSKQKKRSGIGGKKQITDNVTDHLQYYF